jgi:phosphoribosylanthranilate isomerase
VVKICGLTRLEDVLLARDLGAWALGFVFAPSPRRLTPAAARELIQGAAASVLPGAARLPGASDPPLQSVSVPRFPLTVGVFSDVPAGEIARVVEEVDLDAVQLHATEGPGGNAVRAAIAGRDRPLLVIQAVPVAADAADGQALGEAVAVARSQADVVLLDTRTAGRFGGTGTVFSWRLARETGEGALLIAGGIGPQNVETALRESNAWGIDVSSGVERSPGVKDAALMRRLFAQVSIAHQAAWDPAPGTAPVSMPVAAPGAAPVCTPVSTPGGVRRAACADERQEGTDK